ncbi:MAG: hypothetical protein ABH848_01265 [Candidatus Omnitrophota bacterium]
MAGKYKKIRMIDKKLGELLVEWNIIKPDHLERVLSIQKKDKNKKTSFSGEILIRLGLAREENIAEALITQYQFPYLPLTSYQIDPTLTRLVPHDVAKRYTLMPAEVINTTLSVAMADPLNEEAIEAVEGHSKCNVQVFMSLPSDIKCAIDKHYSFN